VVVDGEQSDDAPFPVLAMAIDDHSKWLAILSTYKAALWNLKEKTWGPWLSVDLYGQKPEAFFFGSPDPHTDIPRLVLVRRNGTLTEFVPDAGEGADFGVCRSPLTCVRPLIEKRRFWLSSGST
jgi:hypothetical protein